MHDMHLLGLLTFNRPIGLPFLGGGGVYESLCFRCVIMSACFSRRELMSRRISREVRSRVKPEKISIQKMKVRKG